MRYHPGLGRAALARLQYPEWSFLDELRISIEPRIDRGERFLKRTPEERARAADERLFRGWDLRALGCVWQLAFMFFATVVGTVCLWVGLLGSDRKERAERILAFPGVIMILFAISTLVGLVWLQWNWWRRYRAVHPMFYRQAGKTLSSVVVTLAVGFAGAFWIYLLLFR